MSINYHICYEKYFKGGIITKQRIVTVILLIAVLCASCIGFTYAILMDENTHNLNIGFYSMDSDIDIIETLGDYEKQSVVIKNKSYGNTVFVRANILINWIDEENNVVSSSVINKLLDGISGYELTEYIANDWLYDNSSGYYYYKKPLLSQEQTKNLCSIKDNRIVSIAKYKLQVQIIAEAIEYNTLINDANTELYESLDIKNALWPVTLTLDSETNQYNITSFNYNANVTNGMRIIIEIPNNVTSISFDSFSELIKEKIGLSMYDEIGDLNARKLVKGVRYSSPENIVKIDGAFADCCNLKSFVNSANQEINPIPLNVTEITSNTFKNTAITEIDLSSSRITRIPNSAFENCTSLKTVFLSENIFEINENSFKNCYLLNTINLNNSSVIELKDNVFENCISLIELNISKINSLSNTALIGCKRLTNITCIDNLEYYVRNNAEIYKGNALIAFPGAKGEVYITNDENITKIDKYALANIEQIEILHIPDNITTLDNSFINTNIEKVIYEGNIEEWLEIINNNSDIFSSNTKLYVSNYTDNYVSKINVNKNIPKYAFCDYQFITDVEITTPISIGDYAFKNCSGLTSVTFNNVTTIGNDAFKNCQALISSDLTNITYIGDFAFVNCISMDNVKLPVAISSLDTSSFKYCQFKKIFIPSNILSFDISPFFMNDKLEDIYYGGTQEEWNKVTNKGYINEKVTVLFNRGGF